jgi:hypothetical protein
MHRLRTRLRIAERTAGASDADTNLAVIARSDSDEAIHSVPAA